MAIFSRRTLQRLIYENATLISKKQLRAHVDSLNRADEYSLGTEWEIVLLNVLSKLGTVAHEPRMGSRPDLHFVSNVDRSQEFIADIATVSDRGVDDRFPIVALRIRLSDIIYKKGFRNSAFSVYVGTEVDNRVWPRPNPRLKIPHRSRLESDVFNQEFFQFLDVVSAAPNQKHVHVISSSTPPVDIRITYDPTQMRSSGSWPAYNELVSLVRNTVFSRLEEKAGQLAKANYTGHRAIFICDGGCNHLSTERYWDENHISDVVKYFLKQHLEISFVLTLVVKETLSFEAERTIIATLYPGKSFAKMGSEIRSLFDKMGQYFPEAERSALNAGYFLAGPITNEGAKHTGGYSMNDDEIRISARGLLELLSGKLTQERFFRLHSWTPSANPFGFQLGQGHLITAISVEKGEQESDDDWVTIKFGDSDPAVASFRMPT